MQLTNTAKIIAFLSTGLLGGLGLAYFLAGLIGGRSRLSWVVIALSLAIPLGLPLLSIRPALRIPQKPQQSGFFILVIGLILIVLSGSIGLGLIQLLTGVGYLVAGLMAVVSPAPSLPETRVSNYANYAVPEGRSYGGYAAPATYPYQPQPDYRTQADPPAGFTPTAKSSDQNPFFTMAFNQGVQLAQQGRRQEAHFELGKLYRERPREINLLLWLAFTAPDLHQTRNFIEQAYNCDPQSPSVAQALTWLATQTS